MYSYFGASAGIEVWLSSHYFYLHFTFSQIRTYSRYYLSLTGTESLTHVCGAPLSDQDFEDD